MTGIAIFTIPLSVLGAIIGLYATGNTINVMTLAGLALAIGPLVDSAIICLENTHRHLCSGRQPARRGLFGGQRSGDARAGFVAVHVPGAGAVGLDAGHGRIPFPPHGVRRRLRDDRRLCSVAFVRAVDEFARAQVAWTQRARNASRTARPGVRHLGSAHRPGRSPLTCGRSISCCGTARRRSATGVGLLVAALVILGPVLRREFFPEVDAGAFEIYVRAPTGTRIERTEEEISRVEQSIRKTVKKDLQTIISEIGVVADWSAAYTPNAGPMDAVVKVQLEAEREHSAQEYVHLLREKFERRVPRLGIRLRRRGHDPRRDERGKVDAPQRPRAWAKTWPRPAQSPPPFKTRGRGDSRRRRRPHHPAARLPGVHDRHRPGQGGRPGPHAGGRHEKRRGGAQFEHSVQQEEFLDRSGQPQPVLRRRAVSRSRHPVDRDAAEHPHHQPHAAAAGAAAERRLNPANDGAGRGQSHHVAAHDRPDDGRFRPRPGARGRRRGPRDRQVRQAAMRPRQSGDPTKPAFARTTSCWPAASSSWWGSIRGCRTRSAIFPSGSSWRRC